MIIEEYCHGVINIIDNILRQMDQFEDQDYIDDYLDKLERTTITALLKFQEQPNLPSLVINKVDTLLASFERIETFFSNGAETESSLRSSPIC